MKKTYQILFLMSALIGQVKMVWPEPPAESQIIFKNIIDDPNQFRKKISKYKWLLRFFSNEQDMKFYHLMGIDVKNGIIAVADPGIGGVHLINTVKKSYKFLSISKPETQFHPIDVTIGDAKIYATDPQAKVVQTFSHEGEYLGSVDNLGNLGRPTGIYTINSLLSVVDTPNHLIKIISEDDGIIHSIGKRGIENGMLNFPTFITSNKSGSVYISDTMNFRVMKFTPEGEWEKSFGTRGMMSGQLNRPKGVAIDRENNVYIVDASFDNIQIFSPDGDFLMHFGSPGHQPGQFLMPTDIAIDDDLIYITDTKNNRIQVFQRLNK